MNTKIVMTISALYLIALGVVFSFFLDEVLDYFNIEQNSITILFLQLLSALFWSFGILNWMLKETRIGGIYNRPVAFGNIIHFGVGTISFIKITPSIEKHFEIFIFHSIIYIIFTILFVYIFRTNPS